MTKKINEKEKEINKIKELLNKVKHPEINNSLVELGMIGEIQIKDKVIVELKLPAQGVPIADMLSDLIKEGLKDFSVEVNFSVMNEKEKQKFFELAQKNWAL